MPGLQARMREMFDRMTVAKDITQVPVFYDSDFVLYTNGQIQDYDEFVAGHARVYPTDIEYRVAYDDEAWVETPDRLAGRVFITTSTSGRESTEIEVMFTSVWRDDRLLRLWELTWPDWSQLAELDAYGD